MDEILIEPSYGGSVSYYAALFTADKIIFDLHSYYEKRSYRNRCKILSPNGVLNLSIPLVKGKNQKQLFKDVKISFAEHWQKDHWMSLQSCYRRSPFFEFYEDSFRPLYTKQYEFLYELDLEFFKTVAALLKWIPQIQFTTAFIPSKHFEGKDIREHFLPNKPQQTEPYLQVFAGRSEFVNDLSVLDLLFNLGNESTAYLARLNAHG